MTRKEAIKVLENRTQYFVSVQDLVALNMAIDTLYPVSREQVEKVWRGEWKNYLPSLGTGNIQYRCTTCGRTPDDEMPFCPFCGAAMTDEAVQMVMKRLEVLKDES
jgi:rubrerythrin